MPAVSQSPVSFQSRRIGCLLLSLAWLLLLFCCGSVALIPYVGFAAWPFVIGILFLGPVAVILLGFGFGPRLWPRAYEWIDKRPVLKTIEPGMVVGVFVALLVVWMLTLDTEASIPSTGEGGASGLALLTMFVFSPAVCILGPVVGAIGGLAGGMMSSQLGVKARPVMYIGATFGGAAAGVACGVLPHIVFWLTSLLFL